MAEKEKKAQQTKVSGSKKETADTSVKESEVTVETVNLKEDTETAEDLPPEHIESAKKDTSSSSEKKKKKDKTVKKVHSDDQSSGSVKDYIIPMIVGCLCAVFCVIFFRTGFGKKLPGREGSYTVYLNDDSLSKIGSYTFTSIKQKGNTLIYEGNNTKVIADDGSISIITDNEASSYTNAFILKDTQ